MSDDELDQEWKPSGRPQSTMARSFSLALNDLFKIDNSLADLDASVSEKKQKLSSQTSELEALEARLKATEERLKAASSGTTPSPRSNGRSSPRPRPPIGDTFTNPQSPTKREIATSPLSSEFQRTSRPNTGAGRPTTGTGGRPNTGKREEGGRVGGALPPTPGASEDGEDVAPPPPPKSGARPSQKREEMDSEESD